MDLFDFGLKSLRNHKRNSIQNSTHYDLDYNQDYYDAHGEYPYEKDLREYNERCNNKHDR